MRSYHKNLDFFKPTLQCRFNFASMLCINVDLTLKMKQNPMSDFQSCTDLVQCRCPTLKQRWNNVDTALSRRCFYVASTLVKAVLKPVSLEILQICKQIIKFYSAKYFWQYNNDSTTNKLVNSYSNFLTVVHIGYNDGNGDAHKSSKFGNFKTEKPPWKTLKPSWGY